MASMQRKLHQQGSAATALLLTLGVSCASAQDRQWQGEARDAWIDGKLEASYLINTELNNFDIVTDVNNGHVLLSGQVASQTEKTLAEEIALNLEGVTGVDNQLTIVPDADAYREAVGGRESERADGAAPNRRERDFSTRFHDLTTTARIKSTYALNDQLEALAIDIDTYDGVVTLNGEVDSEDKKNLAGTIAAGFDHVERVENNLRVVASQATGEPRA